ncbi:DUF630 DUF632 domains containing protein [Musa troglodytarum]|uniref:DUF630 DUF632 domains containing protein n=1 Tax=Musa troglodytarum TaxID=320322 RepID=A0A9E7J970_9LILI|nr:DUF630 DUF632 domains containing protein [Musa troglodytarum]
MGCGSSKAEESKLVALCRERTELIRAARDRRYALAAAHAAYFRALAAVGDAFHHFVHEELAPASPPGSPDLVLPSSEGKRKARTGRGSAITSAAASSTSSSVTSLTHSLSPEGSHLPLSSGSESEASPQDAGGSTSFADRKASSVGGGGGGEVSSSSHQPFSPTSPNSTFIRSSTAIPQWSTRIRSHHLGRILRMMDMGILSMVFQLDLRRRKERIGQVLRHRRLPPVLHLNHHLTKPLLGTSSTPSITTRRSCPIIPEESMVHAPP